MAGKIISEVASCVSSGTVLCWPATTPVSEVSTLLGGIRLNRCRADLEHDTLATPFFRYRCSAVLTLKTKKTAVTLSHIQSFMLISGRSGVPLTLSNAASNHVDVRPTSQCRAVSPAALFSAAPDCRWRRWLARFFAWRDIFHQHFRSLICDDDDRALHDLHDLIPLWRHRCYVIQPTYLLVYWSRYATSFFPSSNDRPSGNTTPNNTPFQR